MVTNHNKPARVYLSLTFHRYGCNLDKFKGKNSDYNKLVAALDPPPPSAPNLMIGFSLMVKRTRFKTLVTVNDGSSGYIALFNMHMVHAKKWDSPQTIDLKGKYK